MSTPNRKPDHSGRSTSTPGKRTVTRPADRTKPKVEPYPVPSRREEMDGEESRTRTSYLSIGAISMLLVSGGSAALTLPQIPELWDVSLSLGALPALSGTPVSSAGASGAVVIFGIVAVMLFAGLVAN
jgi:hypothetical protein